MRRQRELTIFGLLLLAIAALTALAQTLDPRLVDGVNTWVKPTKFLVSVALFALTAAWFFGFVRPDHRRSLAMRTTVATLIASASFELLYLGFQAWHGEASHFNTGTPFHAIMYMAMGIGAVLLVTTTVPLAWEIARRPAPGLTADFRASVVIGLVLTFALGGGLGGYMSSQTSHAVGIEGNGLPLVGWNRLGGDLRVAHFFGMHISQVLPVIAWAVSAATPTLRWTAVLGVAGVWVGVTLAVFLQATGGAPLVPMF